MTIKDFLNLYTDEYMMLYEIYDCSNSESLGYFTASEILFTDMEDMEICSIDPVINHWSAGSGNTIAIKTIQCINVVSEGSDEE